MKRRIQTKVVGASSIGKDQGFLGGSMKNAIYDEYQFSLLQCGSPSNGILNLSDTQ